MYLRKSSGPRTVNLPDGSVITLADLPDPSVRWVASRKALVVKAVSCGLLTREEAISRYSLSEEEFDSWCRAIRDHGVKALRVTALQNYRQG